MKSLLRGWSIHGTFFLAIFGAMGGMGAWAEESRAHEWVDLAALNAGFVFDLRYATRQNFTGEVLYASPRAFLRREPAEALCAVQAELRQKGLRLKIFDAYRPLPVQQKMWDLIQDERYVSNPAVTAGLHTRGTSVDVTLVDRRGRELTMPTDFDDFTGKAHIRYKGASLMAKRNRHYLRRVMEKYGFEVYETEWWHFDYLGWREFAPSKASFEELDRRLKGGPLKKSTLPSP